MKLRKAVLQHRADPLPIRETINRDNNGEGRSLGGIVINGQHSFLEAMPQKSWFKVRTASQGQRQVYCGLLRPAFDLK